MVRFIMNDKLRIEAEGKYVYIPIWLDLLYIRSSQNMNILDSLHSNMVRFIIKKYRSTVLSELCVYIPIWLDLL